MNVIESEPTVWLSLTEAAERFVVSRSTLRRYATSGKADARRSDDSQQTWNISAAWLEKNYELAQHDLSNPSATLTSGRSPLIAREEADPAMATASEQSAAVVADARQAIATAAEQLRTTRADLADTLIDIEEDRAGATALSANIERERIAARADAESHLAKLEKALSDAEANASWRHRRRKNKT